MDKKIDIVIRWVDSSDPEWQNKKKNYEKTLIGKNAIDNSNIRYRDWDILRYWFRSVEKNLPWVNKIFFVTCGQKPDWLNTNHPKLVIVDHKDFIPAEWLPTFSSRTIDFNVHRINGLSEQFVFCDDDEFFLRELKETDFFVNGIPCDTKAYNVITALPNDMFEKNIYNNMTVINKHFKKRRENIGESLKYTYNFKYGPYIIKNLMLSQWKNYVGFQDFHVPTSFLKSTLEEIWNKEEELLKKTCSHKFRHEEDVTQFLIRYWQIAAYRFHPRSPRIGVFMEINENNDRICEIIEKKKYSMICLNDGKINDFDSQKKRIQGSFNKIFPNKSGFEI